MLNDLSITVGIGGSFPLYMFMCLVCSQKPTWVPGDCDVYLSCPNKACYLKAVQRFNKLLQKANFPVQRYTPTPVKAAYFLFNDGNDTPFYIMNYAVFFGNTEFKISLIFHEAALFIEDYINGYDFDIVQVAIEFTESNRAQFCLKSDVETAIMTKEAHVIRAFDLTFLSEYVIRSYSSTLRRMQKYAGRGFKFSSLPLLHYQPNPLAESTSPSVMEILEHNMRASSSSTTSEESKDSIDKGKVANLKNKKTTASLLVETVHSDSDSEELPEVSSSQDDSHLFVSNRKILPTSAHHKKRRASKSPATLAFNSTTAPFYQ